MAIIEQRLAAMGLELPEPLKVRGGCGCLLPGSGCATPAPTSWVTSRATGMGHWQNPSARFRQSSVTRQRGSLLWPISRASNGLSKTSIGLRLGCASSP